MIAHHGVRVQTNREDVGQFPQSVFDPIAAMLEGLARQGIEPAQPRRVARSA
ncbi:MAG: hypothetical protein ABIR62_08115 [Dokdonella sp.]|uniref:hypothetical protein n=1 Tax=Dokdonella sp. TaxID=2291710 RepID=UPI0032660842